MSHQGSARALEWPGGTSIERHVLLVIGAKTDHHTDIASLTLDELATKTGYSRSTVSTAVDTLVGIGRLGRETSGGRRASGNHGGRPANSYRVLDGADGPSSPDGSIVRRSPIVQPGRTIENDQKSANSPAGPAQQSANSPPIVRGQRSDQHERNSFYDRDLDVEDVARTHTKCDNEEASPPALPTGEQRRPAGRQEGPRPAEIVLPRPGDGTARLHTIVRHAQDCPGGCGGHDVVDVGNDTWAKCPGTAGPPASSAPRRSHAGLVVVPQVEEATVDEGPPIARARAALGDATPEGGWSLNEPFRALLPKDRPPERDAILFEPVPAEPSALDEPELVAPESVSSNELLLNVVASENGKRPDLRVLAAAEARSASEAPAPAGDEPRAWFPLFPIRLARAAPEG